MLEVQARLEGIQGTALPLSSQGTFCTAELSRGDASACYLALPCYGNVQSWGESSRLTPTSRDLQQL